MGRSFVTPEAVELQPDLAGLGSRFLATLLDLCIQAPLLFAAGLVSFTATSGSTAGAVTLIVLSFLIVWAYNPLFEILWSGQTPGKRAQRIRVVLADGSPITIGAAVVRNLVRIVDLLPGIYAVGVLTMLLDPRSRRAGDIAAGTVVVRELRLPAPAPMRVGPDAARDAASIDVSSLGHRDFAAVRGFLDRREGLQERARRDLAARIAAAIRARVGSGPADDEAFLEAVAVAYRQRFHG